MVVRGTEMRIIGVASVDGEDEAGAVVVTVHDGLDAADRPVVPADTPTLVLRPGGVVVGR